MNIQIPPRRRTHLIFTVCDKLLTVKRGTEIKECKLPGESYTPPYRALQLSNGQATACHAKLGNFELYDLVPR